QSFHAALRGAKHVTCLEPEVEGSRSGMKQTFQRVRDRLGLAECVELKPIPLQSLELSADRFDVGLLHNSINHLDEDACIRLRTDQAARASYLKVLSQIAGLLNNRGVLQISDCSSRNLFAQLRLRNPFAPTIEWHKHQPPEVWAALLEQVGFEAPRVRWS